MRNKSDRYDLIIHSLIISNLKSQYLKINVMTEVIHLNASESAETRNGLAREINLFCSKCYTVCSAVTWQVINGLGSLCVY